MVVFNKRNYGYLRLFMNNHGRNIRHKFGIFIPSLLEMFTYMHLLFCYIRASIVDAVS